MDVNDMNAFLKSICEGQQYERFIKGYSKEIEMHFLACGYISIEDDGIYKRIIATEKGKDAFARGGFLVQEPIKPIHGFNA